MDDIDEKYEGKDDILGKSILTFPNHINSSRTIMFSSHLEQAVVLKKPEFPRLFTNYENMVGKYSNSYYEAKTNFKVVDKIPKFNKEGLEDHIYTLVVHDESDNYYDIITKQAGEQLTEDYGYLYNNDVINSKRVGSEIHDGEILFKSVSYDNYMNYSYGVNAKTIYLIHNKTIEDAMICSESFAKKLVSSKIDSIKVTLNDNDLLGNIYGNNTTYKSFPDVGEKVKNSIITNVKRINYSEALYDLKQENLMKINYLNDKPFYVKHYKNAKVVDINIYSNKPIEELDNTYNSQIIQYLRLQDEYYKRINKVLGLIIDSGAKYSDDIAFMYKRSSDILDPEVKWKNDKSYFNHVVIEFLVESDSGVSVGSKLTGRYGDKGVLSEIIPDEKMPLLENGERVDLICNALGIINRENPAQLYEVELNFIANRVREKMATFNNLKDKRELLFKLIKMINPEQYNSMSSYYEELDEKGKIGFILDSEKNGIYIHQPPLWGNIGLDVIDIIYKEFDWIKRYECYVDFHDRKVKTLDPVVCGEKYIMKLKHDPLGKFSVCSMAHLSPTTDTPCKSMGSKNNVELYSKTPIRFGEMEINNMALNKNMTEMRRMVMMYASSTKARRDTGVLYTGNILDMKKIDITGARNKNADILAVYLKSIGVSLRFKVSSKYRKAFDRIKGRKVFRVIDKEWEE